MAWHSVDGNATALRIVVQPGARRTEVVGPVGDELKVRVAAPPREGKANRELVRFLARILGVAKRDVTLLRGEASRHKTVRVAGRPDLGPLEP